MLADFPGTAGDTNMLCNLGRGTVMATIVDPLVVERHRLRTRPKFYLLLGLTIWVAVFYGFYPSFYLNHWFATPPLMRTLTPLYLIHGLIFSLWVGLAVLQPALILAGKRQWHRRVGWAAVGLAVAVVTIGNVAAIEAMNHGFADAPDRLAFYAVPVSDMIVFATCVGLAVAWRNYADTHKRLMFLAYTQLLHAAVGRYTFGFMIAGAPWTFLFGADLLIILPGALHDWFTRGRIHRVWLIGGALVLLSEPLRLWLGGTGWWHGFAASAAALWPV
jgi:hypothetical protein